MKHCIYYNCLMNGSNNDTEAKNKAFALCPVCHKKLKHAL